MKTRLSSVLGWTPYEASGFQVRSFVEEFLREDGTCEEIERCRLPVKKWRGIRDDVAWDFNQRLKAKKLPQIRWGKKLDWKDFWAKNI